MIGPDTGIRLQDRAENAGNDATDEYGEVKITHRPRSAAEIGLRAARIAGGVPPIIPISRAKIIPAISTTGVTRNAKASDEMFESFKVLVRDPFKGSAARQPQSANSLQ